MKKIEIKTSFQVYASVAELPDALRRLLTSARSALKNAYAPYSKFHVAAAVLLANDEVVTSTNYENAAYPICVCAEHSALISAANRYPGIPPVAVAITVKTNRQKIDRPALPCGSCRQVIVETEHKNSQAIQIILQGESGEVFVFDKGSDILPLAFDGSYL